MRDASVISTLTSNPTSQRIATATPTRGAISTAPARTGLLPGRLLACVPLLFVAACHVNIDDGQHERGPDGTWTQSPGGPGPATDRQLGGPGASCIGDGDCISSCRCSPETRLCTPVASAAPDAGTAEPDTAPPPPPPEHRPRTCRIDAQCGGGRCHDGLCQPRCVSSQTCGTGAVCFESYCQPSPTPGGQCLYSADCGGNGSCINGFCHGACASHADCPNPADVCELGWCRPDGGTVPQCTGNAYCPAGQLCVDAICRTPCMSDLQCGPGCSGTICSAGYCVMPEELAPAPPMCGGPMPGCTPTVP